jgi:Rhodopirellula transposase DDE domain
MVADNHGMSHEEMRARIREQFVVWAAVLDERGRRRWAVTEANALGHGGHTIVARATGRSRRTLDQGLRELEPLAGEHQEPSQRVRRPGGGRKPLTAHEPTRLADLAALVEPTSRGDPASPWRWTCKRVRQLAAELPRHGHKVGRHKVADLLAELAYRRHGKRKTKEGTAPPDGNAPFEPIKAPVAAFQKRGHPVVSVDTKKNALVGDVKKVGREWRPPGPPELGRTDDVADKTLGKVHPYGVYEQTANVGWVSGGVDHDTAEGAVDSIQRWWTKMGSCRSQDATALLITADGGGSHGRRSRLWKVALPRLANATGWRMAVCHFPPGTSTGNKIEHRMFSHISMNWRGQPLTSHEVLVNLLATTTTEKEVKIHAELDTGCYPPGITVTDQELQDVAREPAVFHGEWNYTLTPRTIPN